MTTTADITWGALDFVNPEAAPPADGYLVHAMAGTDFGNPQPLIETIKSMLTDGSLAVLEGWDNREVQIHLRISAPRATAGPALAAAEAVLFAQAQAEAKAPLVYVPPAKDSPTCVFDVVVAKLDRDTSDNWDIQEMSSRAYRYYLLTLTCLPFVRGEETVVVPAITVPPVTPTTVDIDACTSTSGWTVNAYSGFDTGAGGVVPTLSVVSGAVRVSGTSSAFSTPMIEVRRTGAVAMGTTPYLRLSMRTNSTALDYSSITVWNGAMSYVVPLLSVATSSIAGYVDYYVQPPVASISAIDIKWQGFFNPFANPVWAEVAHVARTDTIPGSGTNRQLSRIATVGGSAPTQAAIRLFDTTPAALGAEVLVHTSRNTAWQPALRPFQVTATGVTADTARVSGARNPLGTAKVFRIPAAKFTEGLYSLMALMSVTTSAALTWSVRTVSAAGATTVGSSVVVSGSVTVPVTTGYQILNLAAIPLPVVKVEADQMVELTLTGTANMTLDEAWLFGLHDGALTWLQDAEAMTWIEIRSPELGAPRPSVYGGTGAKGANSACVDWKCQSFGAHRFEPGDMQIFTVASTSLTSQSEIEFYERGHSHMAAA